MSQLLHGNNLRKLNTTELCFYPEVVSGNPVMAKRVIRYVCNVPGLLGGDKNI